MVKIKTELAESVEPEEGKTYVITGVENITTAVQSFQGVRVSMKSTLAKDENKYATVLWARERAGITSKLGSFMAAFLAFFDGSEEKAYDTDNWIGHTIRFNKWKAKNREVTVIK